MKKLLITCSLLIIAGCVDKEGLSPESSRPPTGNANSTIVVEEYADLQCPACKGAHSQIVQPLLAKYGNIVRYEYKHFPLSQIHAFAHEAAEAAECSADQGKFWEFVNDTYEFQEELSRDDLIKRAEKVGVADIELFRRCVQSRIKRGTVQADYKAGYALGVRGTPTFFVSGERVPRNTLEGIGEIIEKKVGTQKL
ncbi:MAG TPA: thioredoxin domain-containing protein [Candidatus Peribacterales bacterium]|nr:thioredoxin domain-containing protein [Candidatus Peribacterales bacterium]